ncbi:UNVERIFIED_CONTAM: hypothetical protein K2H54_026285 [Gekko kuhli]
MHFPWGSYTKAIEVRLQPHSEASVCGKVWQLDWINGSCEEGEGAVRSGFRLQGCSQVIVVQERWLFYWMAGMVLEPNSQYQDGDQYREEDLESNQWIYGHIPDVFGGKMILSFGHSGGVCYGSPNGSETTALFMYWKRLPGCQQDSGIPLIPTTELGLNVSRQCLS